MRHPGPAALAARWGPGKKFLWAVYCVMRSSRWILSYKREPENRAQGARADGEALPGPERIVNMAEYKYVRCLFCTEGMENVVAGAIQASGHGRALVPRSSTAHTRAIHFFMVIPLCKSGTLYAAGGTFMQGRNFCCILQRALL